MSPFPGSAAFAERLLSLLRDVKSAKDTACVPRAQVMSHVILCCSDLVQGKSRCRLCPSCDRTSLYFWLCFIIQMCRGYVNMTGGKSAADVMSAAQSCYSVSSASSRARIRPSSVSLSGLSVYSDGSHSMVRSSVKWPASNISSPACSRQPEKRTRSALPSSSPRFRRAPAQANMVARGLVDTFLPCASGRSGR